MDRPKLTGAARLLFISFVRRLCQMFKSVYVQLIGATLTTYPLNIRGTSILALMGRAADMLHR